MKGFKRKRLILCNLVVAECFFGAESFQVGSSIASILQTRPHAPSLLGMSHCFPDTIARKMISSDMHADPRLCAEYKSALFSNEEDWQKFVDRCRADESDADLFWEQIKYEAVSSVKEEPEAGPQLYQGILSHNSLLDAICTVVAHKIETELIPATEIRNLFFEMLTTEDENTIRYDLEAVVSRSPSVVSAMEAVLFHNGFHALVSYRVGHRLWEADRRALAMYMQSTVSRQFSADIHPACEMGHGVYLRTGAGVVIGETAKVGNDVSILEGVTLGGTGKEAGDRHPKVGSGVIIQDGGTVLGNIPVGDGSVVNAKSIVTKPVPPLAIVGGVPAKIISYRELDLKAFDDDLQGHLATKYLDAWKKIEIETE